MVGYQGKWQHYVLDLGKDGLKKEWRGERVSRGWNNLVEEAAAKQRQEQRRGWGKDSRSRERVRCL